MIKNVKIIATIGDASYNSEVLKKLKNRSVDYFRINLSHTSKEDIEKKIVELKTYGVPLMLDTEGRQIRTGNVHEISFEEGDKIRIYNREVETNNKTFFLRPLTVVEQLEEGTLIFPDFNSALIKISDTSTIHKGFIEGHVLLGGKVGGRKGVHLEPKLDAPPFSEKDRFAIELAKKHGIKHFSLSFINNKKDLLEFKKLYHNAAFLTKIETKESLKNLEELLEFSEGILLDRGDLSREIPLQKLPFVQKSVIKKTNELNKEVYVATNTLENMSVCRKPSKSEVNDVINTLLDGATGFVLTKETAIGNYPIETLNMLSGLIREFDENKDLSGFDITNTTDNLLVPPHGGKLVERYIKSKLDLQQTTTMPKISIGETELMDVEQIACGAFSPLEGFMNKEDLMSVLHTMKLRNGIVWPMPIVLQTKTTDGLMEGQDVLLVYKKDSQPYAMLHLEQIYQVDMQDTATKWFGTTDLNHPGVKMFFDLGQYFLAGKIDLIKRRNGNLTLYALTPRQTRRIFSERGWSKIVAFHTRNVIHRSHEFIQMDAMEKYSCDGLFIHPVIGKKKKGDFEASAIVASYEKMINEIYPKGKVIFSTFSSYSRYAGPREAVFTALVRKNFGCSHFIVGRDHTGVKNYYDPLASHKIFDQFEKDELGIVPIKYNRVFYSLLENRHIHECDYLDHPENQKKYISGTQARKLLMQGKAPPEWFMRPEISQLILNKINKGENVFVSES